MGRKAKKAKAEEYSPSEEGSRKRKSSIEAVISDDDAEANEDLSLKIVQKSLLLNLNNDAHNDDFSEVVTNLKEEKKKKEKKKRKKSEDVEVPLDNEKDKEKPETDKATEVSTKAVGTNPVVSSDNAVLRKLLRGPRYFDPPDNNSWGACYNCGEEGHSIANCTSAKRKKPCFVCGSFEHNARQCSKGRDCLICRAQGHRAKNCPEKNVNSKLCLKCGDSGHDMFSCRNDYHPDDLKEIQCYICGNFGHLCCVDYSDPSPLEVSCYRCGLSGHTGLACTGSHGDKNNTVSTSSCYKCGVEGHFARECTNSMKAGKRNREPSTPKQKKNRDHKKVKSAPHDFGRKHKTKRSYYEEFTSPAKPKRRGGWITEDPGDHYYSSKTQANNWRSPATPRDRRSKISSSNGDYASNSRYGDYASNSHSFKKPRKFNFNHSASNGYPRYQPRYSATRFGSNSNDGRTGRNYDWW